MENTLSCVSGIWYIPGCGIVYMCSIDLSYFLAPFIVIIKLGKFYAKYSSLYFVKSAIAALVSVVIFVLSTVICQNLYMFR